MNVSFTLPHSCSRSRRGEHSCPMPQVAPRIPLPSSKPPLAPESTRPVITMNERHTNADARTNAKTKTWDGKHSRGSGIWSYTLRSAGAILFVNVPATIMMSDCLGLARKTTPRRSWSYLAAAMCIISTAQQARPRHDEKPQRIWGVLWRRLGGGGGDRKDIAEVSSTELNCVRHE